MGKIILVSNRLPFNIKRVTKGFEFTPSIGGLATALGSFYRDYDSVWVGWPGITTDECIGEEKERIGAGLEDRRCRGVFLSKDDLESYYEGFSNRTIWPLFHYFITETRMDPGDWEAYRKVNEAFAEEVLKVANKYDTIWVHDYHLFLLPELLRERLPELSIGFFLHIPFPSSEVFRTLPWRNEILRGLMGADLIGFHTYDYVLHFISSVRRLLGHENTLGYIGVGARTVKVGSFPISIDFDHYSNAPHDREVIEEISRIRKRVGDRKIIISIDRMDYTKGIPNRIRAYGRFLEKYPEYHEKVTLINVASPSRIGVDTYQDLKLEVEQLVGDVNGRYTTLGWVPLWYIFQNIPQNQLIALYCCADVALITPLRDGMNLIAKEYITARGDNRGVLILSELAGAAKELGEALHVNPSNIDQMADAIHEALEMPEAKQIRSNRIMRDRIRKYDVDRWAKEFFTDLQKVKEIQVNRGPRRLDKDATDRMLGEFATAEKGLLMLDYDGTLTDFKGTPGEALPDEDLKSDLSSLINMDGIEVVIVSGREKKTLNDWFGKMDVGIIAEHGVWLKPRGRRWRMIEELDGSWKEKIRPVLESYVIKTPGAFVEEKGYSLAWHYRKADQNQAHAQISEMKETLYNMISNLNVGLLDGNRVIEVKNMGVNKGRAVKRWMDRRRWDFILAVGDDWTDEDMFAELPDDGYSIRVGYRDSGARYSLRNVEEVRGLIKRMANIDRVQRPEGT